MSEALDSVVNPAHYKFKNFEAFDILEEIAPDDPLLWQVLKYAFRFGRKGGLAARVHDAGKIVWYATKLLLREKNAAAKRAREASIEPVTTMHPAFPEGGVTVSTYPDGKL